MLNNDPQILPVSDAGQTDRERQGSSTVRSQLREYALLRMVATRRALVVPRSLQIIIHDWLLRIHDELSKGRLRPGAPSGHRRVMGRVRDGARVIGSIWREGEWISSLAVPESGSGGAGSSFSILDRSPRRHDENLHIASVAAEGGFAYFHPRFSISTRARATIRALFLILAYPALTVIAKRLEGHDARRIRVALESRGVRIRNGEARFAVVLENFCLVDLAVERCARNCRRRSEPGVVIYRNGGWQVASAVFRARHRTSQLALRSVHLVHSSRTGAVLPEACVYADAIIVRSRYQARELDVGVVPVLPVGRIPHDRRGGGPDTGAGHVLIAMTQRSPRAMSGAEWSGLIRVLHWADSDGRDQCRIRFKDAPSAIEGLHTMGQPTALIDRVSRDDLERDLQRSSLVVVVAADGHVSTVLHDALARRIPAVNTTLDGASPTLLNPSGPQKELFLPIEELVSSPVHRVIEWARGVDIHSADDEAGWSDEAFLQVLQGTQSAGPATRRIT